MFKKKYSDAFKDFMDRRLKEGDGFETKELSECAKRLKLKLPLAFREYYEFAGRLPINTQHNILYDPKKLKIWKGKLLFMEENQRVVFWGLDLQELHQATCGAGYKGLTHPNHADSCPNSLRQSTTRVRGKVRKQSLGNI